MRFTIARVLGLLVVLAISGLAWVAIGFSGPAPPTLPAAPNRMSIFKPKVISQPGRYVVMNSIDGGDSVVLDVRSNDVSIDLNGFSLRSTTLAVRANGSRFTLRNGHINNPGGRGAGVIVTGDTFTIERLSFTSGVGNGIVANGRYGMIAENKLASEGFLLSVSGDHNVIRDNIVNAGAESGRSQVSGNGCTVSGNSFEAGALTDSILGVSGNGNHVVSNSTWGGSLRAPAIEISGTGSVIRENTCFNAGIGLKIQGDRNYIVGNVLTDHWGGGAAGRGFGLLILGNDNVYSANVSRGNAGVGCAGTGTDQFCDEGAGNTSAGDNFMPGPM